MNKHVLIREHVIFFIRILRSRSLVVFEECCSQILGGSYGVQIEDTEIKKWPKLTKIPSPGLKMSGHPFSGRKELCIHPAVSTKFT